MLTQGLCTCYSFHGQLAQNVYLRIVHLDVLACVRWNESDNRASLHKFKMNASKANVRYTFKSSLWNWPKWLFLAGDDISRKMCASPANPLASGP